MAKVRSRLALTETIRFYLISAHICFSFGKIIGEYHLSLACSFASLCERQLSYLSQTSSTP